jgi:hypothetical protein
MADAEQLPDEVKIFIVQALACFDPPSVVVAAVKEEFALTVSPQRVIKYNPTKKSGEDLGQELKAIFAETRKRFLAETAEIGIANRSYRLRKLDRIAQKAEAAGNHVVVMAACEAAAKEIGGAFTNRQQHEHSGPNGKPLAAGVVVLPADLSGLSTEQLTQLYRDAASSSSRIEFKPDAAGDREGTVPARPDADIRPVGVDLQSEGSSEGKAGIPAV